MGRKKSLYNMAIDPEHDPFQQLIQDLSPEARNPALFEEIAEVNIQLAAGLSPHQANAQIPKFDKELPFPPGTNVYVTGMLTIAPQDEPKIKTEIPATKMHVVSNGIELGSNANGPQLGYAFLCHEDEEIGYIAPTHHEEITHIAWAEIGSCLIEAIASEGPEVGQKLYSTFPSIKETIDRALNPSTDAADAVARLRRMRIDHPDQQTDDELFYLKDLVTKYFDLCVPFDNSSPYTVRFKGLFHVADETTGQFDLSSGAYSTNLATHHAWVEGLGLTPELIKEGEQLHANLERSVPALVIRICEPTETSIDSYLHRVVIPLTDDVSISK